VEHLAMVGSASRSDWRRASTRRASGIDRNKPDPILPTLNLEGPRSKGRFTAPDF
jgi:hypothetical protein